MAGKGSSPRNNFSQTFRENYDKISWGNKRLHERICECGGSLIEASVFDAWDGTLTCDKCGNKILKEVCQYG